MHTKIVGNSKSDNNKGSSEDLASYLEKEDKEKPFDQRTHFFNSEEDRIRKSRVVSSLDGNNKKLKQKEAKFFMVNISPSAKEQAHILKKITGREIKEVGELSKNELKAYEHELKSYTKEVIKNYAQNLNRDNLDEKGILWYGKVEHTREYKGTDPLVKEGKAKSGAKKEGLQSHIHVLVSRKEKGNGRSISPFSRSKGNSKNHELNGKKVQQGFNRKEFYSNNEQSFDTKFDYQRPLKEHFMIRDAIKQSHRFENLFKKLQSVIKNETNDQEVNHATKEGKMIGAKASRVGINTGIAYAKGGSKLAVETLKNSSVSAVKSTVVGQMSKLAMINPKLMVAVTLVKNTVGILEQSKELIKTKDNGLSR